MTANDLSVDELAEALLRGASGMYTCEASIRLLLAHGVWPVSGGRRVRRTLR